MTTYSATRVSERFYEFIHDGGMTACDCTEDYEDCFNVNMDSHRVDIDELTFDSVAELVAAMRRDGVTFDAAGYADIAADPDGSFTIDYATAEREAIHWNLSGISAALLARVIVPAVDAR